MRPQPFWGSSRTSLLGAWGACLGGVPELMGDGPSSLEILRNSVYQRASYSRGRSTIWQPPGPHFRTLLVPFSSVCPDPRGLAKRSLRPTKLTPRASPRQGNRRQTHSKNMPTGYPSARRHPNEGLQREAGSEKGGRRCAPAAHYNNAYIMGRRWHAAGVLK